MLIFLIRWKNVYNFFNREDKKVILLGDTNCDILPRYSKEGDANSNDLPSHSLRLLEIHYLFSFHLLIESPSCEILTTTAMVDNIATTNKTNIVTSGIHKSCLSDHYLLGNFVVLAKSNPKIFLHGKRRASIKPRLSTIIWGSIGEASCGIQTIQMLLGLLRAAIVAPPHSV